jgi:hypothetical protein
MPSPEEIIRASAPAFAKSLIEAAAHATKEEEIRIAVERELQKLETLANIKLQGRHEFTVASGRVDSVYDRVIIEYKNPRSASRIGTTLENAGSRKLVEQIKSRSYDLRSEQGFSANSLFGVGTDGAHFIFVKFRSDQWEVQQPVPVSVSSSERFLRALFNLGRNGKALTPANLAVDFGGSASLAREGVYFFYRSLVSTSHPKTITLFGQWKILFSEVSGYNVASAADKLGELAELYGVDPDELQPAELMFALQTYYALLMKLLAAEILSYHQGHTSPIQRLSNAASSASLRRQVEEVEAGGIFRHLNITNFLEGDLFSWYASEWAQGTDEVVRRMTIRLDEYNPGTLSEDVAGTRDLLKKLYHELFPRRVRHALGEYYTPDWLAKHTLENSGFKGDADTRLLDPSCGSGTFLVEAINSILHRFESDRENISYDETGLGERILRNVVGFDLNPIAVLAARTNFLIAIRELLPRLGKIDLPIYLCDSIVTPSEYSDLFSGEEVSARVPCVAIKPPYLMVPKEIARNSASVAAYSDALQHALTVDFSSEQFLQFCAEENLGLTQTAGHVLLYEQLVRLKRENRNGVWARIIKNAFAPLFAGVFDFVVGNPPWVNWESLPDDYRNISQRVWSQYGLQGGFSEKRRFSSERSKTDVSILLTYVSADKYLAPGGRLSFVITRTVFQSEVGGRHFREFRLPDGRFLSVAQVNDFDALKPFRGQATNLTCTFVLAVGEPTIYPVQWRVWVNAEGSKVTEDDELEDVRSKTRTLDWTATPVDRSHLSSSWLFGDREAQPILQKVLARSYYEPFAREGINTRGANGIFFVDARQKNKSLLITNRAEDGRNRNIVRHETSIEPDYLYPLLRGRDVKKWIAEPSGFVVLPHHAVRPFDVVALYALPRKTREYFVHFREQLAGRKKFRNFDSGGEDFYGLYSVLNATFAAHKVVWREMADGAVAAVCSSSPLPDGTEKTVIPDHKLFVIPCTSLIESQYVAGVFNSTIASYLVKSYAISTGISTHILNRLNIPRFDLGNSLHRQIQKLAAACCEGELDEDGICKAEAKLDSSIATMYGLSDRELNILIHAHNDLKTLSGIALPLSDEA